MTFREKICTSLKQQFELEEFIEESIVRLRRAYHRPQTTTTRSPVEAGQKLLTVGQIRIEWIVSRLRKQISLRGSFKCLILGELATNPF